MLVIQVLCWVAFGLAGGYIWSRKGYSPPHGVIIGVLTGPLGLLVSALCPQTAAALEEDEDEERLKRELIAARKQKTCPKCGCSHSVINEFCPHCMHRYSDSRDPATTSATEPNTETQSPTVGSSTGDRMDKKVCQHCGKDLSIYAVKCRFCKKVV